MRTRIILLLVVILLSLPGNGISVRAQGEAQVSVYTLHVGDFPTITAGMDVFDDAGNFITGLTPGEVTVREDEHERALEDLQELQPGAQFVIALNTGAVFAKRDANAVSRLDTIRQALLDWAGTQSSGRDDINLAAVGIPDLVSYDAASMQAALAEYKPDPNTLVPTLDTLNRALDLASVALPEPGSKRLILFITPLPDPETFATLQNLSARALSMNVRICAWIVADADQFTIAGASVLKDLATQSGGEFFLFSGPESLPSPETYLAPLRHTYSFSYTSALNTSGAHTLSVSVDAKGMLSQSEPLSFDLIVQPPNPMLVTPPDQVLRQPPDEKTTDILLFLPKEQSIEMLVEFPDGHPRPIIRTALFVDGELAAENTAPPFENFTWDLSMYTTSGEHILQVEADDSLGLTQVSLGVPVTVTILQPRRGLAVSLNRNTAWIALAAILIAGGLLAVVMISAGRKRRLPKKRSRRSRGDPLTQPVEAAVNLPPRRLHRQTKPASAHLVRLRSDGQPVTSPSIQLHGGDVTFGSDPTQVTNILNDPSVAPLHARIRQEGENFLLMDERSPAGTWVNYEQIHAPHRLQHGDLFHIGRVAYRFLRQEPPGDTAPRLTPTKK